MRHLYTLLLYLALPLIVLRLALRGLHNRGYWRHVAERFGFGEPPGGAQPPLWIHAVSVGEVQAAALLVREIRRRAPGLPLLITMMTPTGRERAAAVFGREAISLRYLPYDVPDAIVRFLRSTRPRALVLIETELWPNLIHACRRRRIPVVLANARLSARSATGYARIGSLVRELLQGLDVVAAQTEEDARRLVQLGAVRERVRVTGSVKFDVVVPADLEARARALRASFGSDRVVWIAASTHPPEESAVLDAFEQIRRTHPDALLIFVPRHPERFDAVAAACAERGLSVRRRSLETKPGDQSARRARDFVVYVGDTMGELMLLYAASDVVFVGGSLTPVGGHNYLEPAALGRAILTGPHQFNFADIARGLSEHDALRVVADVGALASAVIELLADEPGRAGMGARARDFVAARTGSSARVAEMVLSAGSNPR